jgi:hypothetical protein
MGGATNENWNGPQSALSGGHAVSCDNAMKHGRTACTNEYMGVVPRRDRYLNVGPETQLPVPEAFR